MGKKKTTTYINPVLVYGTSVLFIISTLGVRDCSFCQLFGASLYRTLKNNKLALLVGKKRESENVDHFCVFFNLFRERKLIKVFFRCFRHFFFFLAHVSREEKGNFIFIVFFIIHC